MNEVYYDAGNVGGYGGVKRLRQVMLRQPGYRKLKHGSKGREHTHYTNP